MHYMVAMVTGFLKKIWWNDSTMFHLFYDYLFIVKLVWGKWKLFRATFRQQGFVLPCHILDRALPRLIPRDHLGMKVSRGVMANCARERQQLTQLTRELTERILALVLFCVDYTALDPYCKELGTTFSNTFIFADNPDPTLTTGYFHSPSATVPFSFFNDQDSQKRI